MTSLLDVIDTAPTSDVMVVAAAVMVAIVAVDRWLAARWS